MKSFFSQPLYQSSASRVTTSTCVIIVVTSVVAHFKLTLFHFQCRFLHFLTFFLTLHLLLGATTKEWKESIGYPDSELYAKSFEETKIN